MVNKIELLEALRKVYNHKLNTKIIPLGLVTGEMKIISIDIINKNNYQSINNNISDYNKLYVKNQETNEDVYICMNNLTSYSLEDDKITFITKEGTYTVSFGFSLSE